MRLAPRLAVSLPLSGLFLLAQAASQDLAAATLAAALGGAMLAPAQRAAGVLLTALAAAAVTLLLMAGPFGATAVLAALPPIGNLALAWHFGRTLAPGQEALITRYTRADLGEPAPGLAAYTRRLTLFWTGFFLLFALLGVMALAGTGPSPGAVATANIALSTALFLAEHALRHRLFPNLPTHPWRTLRAIWRVDGLADAR
jgi:uncharacterized membrane protein